MTIAEEIEQLKVKLTQTAEERQQGEILLEILKKYEAIGGAESQPYIEQLLVLAEKLSEPRYKAWGLYHLTDIKYVKGEYEVALDLSRQALATFEKIKEVKGISSCYNNIGTLSGNQGNYPEALKNHFVALKLREEIEDKFGIADSYNNIGVIYEKQGNYPEALKSHFAALKLKEETGSKNGIALSYNNIGVVYAHQGNYPQALKNFFTSLKLREEIGDKHYIAKSYNTIGVLYGRQGNYPEALKNFSAAVKLQEELGTKQGISDSYQCIGVVYEKQGNYPEALKNFFAAMKLNEEIGDKWGLATAYNYIGGAYQLQGNYHKASSTERAQSFSQALKNHFASLKLAEEIGSQHLIKQGSLGLSNAYKATHDFENALKYHEKYHQVESEMLGEQAQKQLTNLSFMHNLEQKEKDLEIEQLRNVELKKERDRSESLLLNILPSEVAEELKEKGTADARHFDNVTVLFTDFKGFTTLSEKLSPQQLVDELHACFSAFDEICGKYKIEKIKTVGDAYLAVSGLPLARPNHAEEMLKAAIEIRNFMATRKSQIETFEVRIGVHSGSVVAGIVGVKKFAYDIWGDTVNTAARMEQNSEAGKINISQSTYDLVKNKFNCGYRGEIEAKNKGKLKMYFVN